MLNSIVSYDENTQYEKGINVIVGGNSLGRGVTFPQLQTIYYCRVAKSPQADTNCGNMQECLAMTVIPACSVYSCHRNCSSCSLILTEPTTVSSSRLKTPATEVTLRFSILTGLKPTRKNVLGQKAVGIYSGGVNYFPFYPVNKDNRIHWYTLLQSFGDDSSTVSLKLIKVMEQLDSETADDWNAKAFIGFVNTLLATDPTAQGKLIVRRNRDIGKGTGNLLSPPSAIWEIPIPMIWYLPCTKLQAIRPRDGTEHNFGFLISNCLVTVHTTLGKPSEYRWR